MHENMHLRNMRTGYIKVIEHVLRYGRRQEPRGLPTRAVSNMHIELQDPTDALPVGIGRKVSLAVAAVESVQLAGAFVDPALMVRISRNFERFMDDGGFWGGYGQRVGQQVLHAGRKLNADRDTRQAVVTLWNPSSDNVPGKRDYPCTLSLVFQVFDNALELSVTMRSNDVWLGLAYDVFVFTQLQLTMARWLQMPAGPYHHHAVNMHIYESDLPTIENLHNPAGDYERPPVGLRPLGFGRPSQADLYAVLMRARAIGQGRAVKLPTPSEMWYMDNLARFIEARP